MIALNLQKNGAVKTDVYESNGQLYVDVNPDKNRRANIHTKCDNDFYGEPDMPIRESLEVEFVPYRDVWN